MAQVVLFFRNSSGSKETSTLLTSENRDSADVLAASKATKAVIKDRFTDLLAVLQEPKHLGTVIVNSEADDTNPSLAEELHLKAK